MSGLLSPLSRTRGVPIDSSGSRPATSVRAGRDERVGQFSRARQHDLVAAVHLEKLELSEPRRHPGMEIAGRQRLVLAAGDDACANDERVKPLQLERVEVDLIGLW